MTLTWEWKGFDMVGRRHELRWPQGPADRKRLAAWVESVDWDGVPDAGYARISDDKSSDEHGVGNQLDHYIPAAAARWNRHLAPDVFNDNDLSALDPMVFRPEFHRLIAALDEGRINGVVVQDADRFLRRHDDLQLVLDVWHKAELIGRRIRPLADSSRTYDLHNQADQQALEVKVLVGRGEGKNTSRRAIQNHRLNAEKGKVPGGFRTFGWTAKRAALDPRESEAIREAVLAKIDEGVGWGTVATRWNSENLLSPWAGMKVKKKDGSIYTYSGIWLPANVRSVLLHPRNAGYSTHKGELVIDPKTGDPVMGKWEPIITETQWRLLMDICANEDDPKSSPRGGSGSAEYLLSSILRCGKCGKGLIHGGGTKKDIYKCPPKAQGGCAGIVIRRDRADRWVTELVFAKLEERASRRVVNEGFAKDGELTQLEQNALEIQTRMLSGTSSSPGMLLDMLESTNARIAELKRERDLVVVSVERERRVNASTRESWEKWSLPRKRRLVQDVLRAVIVRPSAPAPKGVHVSKWVDPDRLVPVPVEE